MDDVNLRVKDFQELTIESHELKKRNAELEALTQDQSQKLRSGALEVNRLAGKLQQAQSALNGFQQSMDQLSKRNADLSFEKSCWQIGAALVAVTALGIFFF